MAHAKEILKGQEAMRKPDLEGIMIIDMATGITVEHIIMAASLEEILIVRNQTGRALFQR